DLEIRYDTTFIDLDNASVLTGALTDDWSVAATVDDAAGTAALTLSSTTPLASGSGSVAVLHVFVETSAPAGGDADLLVDLAQLNGGKLPTATSDGTISFNARTLVVTDVFVGANTATMTLSSDTIDESLLNLYSADGSAPPDIRLVGDVSGPIAGSLHWDASLQELHFVKTDGTFAPDNYTLTIESRADGLVDDNGNLLDGNDDGIAGDDFVFPFAVAASADPLLSLPHVVRGPNQAIALDGAPGIPLTIGDGAGVTSIDFVLLFNPATFDLDSAALTNDIPPGWTISVDEVPGAGVATIVAEGSQTLPAGEFTPLRILGAAAGPRGTTGLLEIVDPIINGGAISARIQNSFQTSSFFGDTTGDGTYSALDASFIARVAVGLQRAFEAYPNIDPALIADVTGDGTISSLDASFVARKAVGFPQPEIPDLPTLGPPPEQSFTSAESALALDGWSLATATADESHDNTDTKPLIVASPTPAPPLPTPRSVPASTDSPLDPTASAANSDLTDSLDTESELEGGTTNSAIDQFFAELDGKPVA
ncbi:MAG: hypothetical protein KDA42_15305, partial [Planctomycetales bacterium]|nr:hypothetical protein [Planctomycetales bacterium]